jgi:uncharacterized membrane protein YbhN (UPF0104 family)
VRPVIFAVVSWLFSLLVYLMVFYSLNFEGISIVDLTLIYCISATVETITAGFPVGAVEITMINLYSLYGVPLVVAGGSNYSNEVVDLLVPGGRGLPHCSVYRG